MVEACRNALTASDPIRRALVGRRSRLRDAEVLAAGMSGTNRDWAAVAGGERLGTKATKHQVTTVEPTADVISNFVRLHFAYSSSRL